MSERSDWGDLRGRRMTESGAGEGYVAERRVYELDQAVRTRRMKLGRESVQQPGVVTAATVPVAAEGEVQARTETVCPQYGLPGISPVTAYSVSPDSVTLRVTAVSPLLPE